MKALVAALLSVLVCSCAVQNPQTRIEKNRPLFDSLSPKHQDLVAKGEIAEGMPYPAVFLALGNPDRKSRGRREGRDFDRWDYTSLQPVMHNNFHYGYWGGWGRYHRMHGWGLGQSIEYIPYRSSSVWFMNGKVDSWEFVGRPR